MALINLRNALMTGRRLPYDAELEYLESTGTQYIETGVIPDWNTKLSVTAAATATTEQFMGAIDASTNRFHFSFYSAGYFRGCVGREQISMGSANLLVHTFTIDAPNNTVSEDGTSYSFVKAGSVPSISIWLFGRNSNNPSYVRYIKIRICSCQIYQNGVLVRDYIPVRKGTVGYLYDRISGKLFGNAGTGDFVLGQDVVPMTWQDGLQYNNVGTPVESATSSIGLDYIPITAGHSFTWRLGYGSSASADLIIYNANKERIDYWVARDRTVTISGAAAYMRISALTSYKEQATVYDETAQKYVFANGRIPTGGTS